MKIINMLAVLVAPASMLAQDAARSLDLRFQIGVELTRPCQSVFYRIDNHNLKAQPGYQYGLQARMLGELPILDNFYYQFGGRVETASRLDYNPTINAVQINTRDVQVAYSYFSFGGGYLVGRSDATSLGLHLEGRLEAISISGPLYADYDQTNIDNSTSYMRPWFRVSLDYTFDTQGRARPIIGVEGAYPLTNREQRHYWSIGGEAQEKRLLESIAPQGSVAAYIGFRL